MADRATIPARPVRSPSSAASAQASRLFPIRPARSSTRARLKSNSDGPYRSRRQRPLGYGPERGFKYQTASAVRRRPAASAARTAHFAAHPGWPARSQRRATAPARSSRAIARGSEQLGRFAVGGSPALWRQRRVDRALDRQRAQSGPEWPMAATSALHEPVRLFHGAAVERPEWEALSLLERRRLSSRHGTGPGVRLRRLGDLGRCALGVARLRRCRLAVARDRRPARQDAHRSGRRSSHRADPERRARRSRRYPDDVLERTVLDIARRQSFTHAVVVLDHVLRFDLLRREVLASAVEALGRVRGCRQAAAAVAFADARAESPGESISRVTAHLLGVPAPELQHEFATPRGRFRTDFWWPDAGVIGEFDGRLKYDAPEPSGTRRPVRTPSVDCRRYAGSRGGRCGRPRMHERWLRCCRLPGSPCSVLRRSAHVASRTREQRLAESARRRRVGRTPPSPRNATEFGGVSQATRRQSTTTASSPGACCVARR